MLRELGIPVRIDQIRDALLAVGLVGLERRDDFYHALRSLMVSRGEEIPLFNLAFAHYWLQAGSAESSQPAPVPLGRPPPALVLLQAATARVGAGERLPEYLDEQRTYSPVEALRERDFQAFTQEELEEARRLILRLPPSFARRRTRRLVSNPHGPGLDLRRSLRSALRSGGEMTRLRRRSPKLKVRPVVALLDVSGSMEPYAAPLLHFLHALSRRHGHVEVFLFATRLTRVTTHLATHRLEAALRQAAGRAHDWAGGTRTGEVLREFNSRWAWRLLGRGTQVVILSDGWDRGQPELLSREMARLAQRAYRVLWLNPLLGSPDYQPLTEGMRAALPHIDDFLPAHNLRSLEKLARRLAGAG